MEFTLRRSKFFTILFAASVLVPIQSYGMAGMGFPGNGEGLAPNMVRQMGQALMEGMQRGFDSQAAADGMGNMFDADRAANAFFGAMNRQFQNNGQADQAVRNFFNTLGQGAANQGIGEFARNMQQQFQNGGNVQGAMNDFFDMFGQQFQDGGQANQAMGDFFNMFGQQFQNGGDADQAMGNFFNMFGQQFRDGGEAHAAMNDFYKMNADQFVEGGQAHRFQQNATANAGEAIRGVGGAFNHVFRNWGITAALSVAGIAAGWYGSKVFWRHFERQLMRPKLILESSKKSYYQRLKNFILRRKEEFTPMIFSKKLQERLENIAKATQNINTKIKAGKKNVKYRNLLLYGPPGTGKTMFANQLAKKSGMEFVMMSGSSFAKFSERGQAIQELDELFKWAKKSKGLMIFIDEAESFLSKREKMDPTSDTYQVLTNFLNYTGERSDRFMIVMATNHKDVLDSAMYRRIDDLVEVPLPNQAQREKVLALYRDRILFDERQNGTEFVTTAKRILTNAKIQEMARETEHLSNGDLEGIINTIKTDADITDDGLITRALVDTVVDRAVTKQRTFAQQPVHASVAIA